MEKFKKRAQKFHWTRQFDSPDRINPELLGNKGANLALMTRLELPVPPGFILTTHAWRAFNQNMSLSPKIWQEVLSQLAILEEKTDKKFNDGANPLLVSVRSGAFYSMPGMMETVLNIGLTANIMPGLIKQVGRACAKDSDHRLKAAFQEITGEKPFPDPYQQLRTAIEAVFSSWNNPRAMSYRRYNAIPASAGTAVSIQEMKFGNIPDNESGAGVFFTRNPRTGAKRATGEFVFAGQGEDIVQEKKQAGSIPARFLPILKASGKTLEEYFRSPQDLEFTVEKGALYLLQSRHLAGTALARVRISLDLAAEGLISLKEAYQRVRPADKEAILRPGFEEKALKEARKTSLLGQGKPASLGSFVGQAVLDSEAIQEAKPGKKLVFICRRLNPNDLATFLKVQALVTDEGGTTSHLALISQALGKTAIVGAEWQTRPRPGEIVSVNAASGEIFRGAIPLAKKTWPMKEFFEKWQEVWGQSVWAAALYPTDEKHDRGAFLNKIKTIRPEIDRWQASKAQTTVLLNQLIPAADLIQSVVIKPDDFKAIRRCLKTILQQPGFQPIPRSCYYPEQLIAPWAAIASQQEIEGFLTDADFPGKYGGLAKWQQTPGLNAIIIPAEPVGKLDPSLAKEHFAFTISCLASQPPRVVVDLQLEEAHLRGFEAIPPERLIQIVALINYDSPAYLGEIKINFGKTFQQDPYAMKVSQLVKQKVFQEWWQAPFALPHLMAALSESYGLVALEAQGRMKDKKELAWGPLVYGAKGREEKEKVNSFPR